MNDWTFDKPMYLLLNVAVGGFWGGYKGIDGNIFPQSMEVDYVRVFKRNKLTE
jgi:beta-glucanase (GH16 family)